jgi:hypothetical protein
MYALTFSSCQHHTPKYIIMCSLCARWTTCLETFFPEPQSSVNMAVVISLSIMIVVALLVEFLSGQLVMWCWFKRSLKTSTEETWYSVPPNAVYDEVSHDRGVSVQLTTNEAYGHVQ